LLSRDVYVADNLNCYWLSLIWPASPWFYLTAPSYFPPVYWSLLFNYSFYWLNLWTLFLKSSIWLISWAVSEADNLSFYWPYLTCPARPLFSSTVAWSLCLNALSSSTNWLLWAFDNLSFSWVCLASATRSRFSPPRPEIIPSAYFNFETNERFSFVLVSNTWLSLSIYWDNLLKSCSWISEVWAFLFNCSFSWAKVVTLVLKVSI
jgi:hypothetical protein